MAGLLSGACWSLHSYHSLSSGLSSEILGLDKPLLSARAFPQFPKQLLHLMVLV